VARGQDKTVYVLLMAILTAAVGKLEGAITAFLSKKSRKKRHP